MNITIKYGADQMNKYFESDPTIGQVVENAHVRAELGYGDNVRALLHGVEQPNTSQVADGSIIVIETRANQKAVVAELVTV